MRLIFGGLPLLISLSLAMVPQITTAQVVELVEEATKLTQELKLFEAEKLWRQVIQLQPNDALAHARLGSILFYQDKIDEGIAAYQQAIKIKPSAKIYNDYSERLQSKDKLNEAIGAYKEALKLEPNNDSVHSSLGLIYLRQKKYTEAIAETRKSVAINPSSDNYESLGDALAEAGNFDEAITAYRQAIKIEPKNNISYNKIVETFKKQGKINDAIATYRQAINVDSSNLFTYINLAELVKFPKSITVLTQYAKKEPENDVPLQALGYIFKENKKLNESAAAYSKAISINPSTENYFSLAEVLAEQNNLNEAVAAYRKALKDGGDDRHSQLAEVLVKQNKLNEALAVCQKVIDIKYTLYKSYRTCSVTGFGIYQKQGLKKVMTIYQQLAAKIAPKDMADVYIKLGNRIRDSNNYKKEDAIFFFKEALKLNPDNSEAQESLKELQSTQ